jgi:hypothetical protein
VRAGYGYQHLFTAALDTVDHIAIKWDQNWVFIQVLDALRMPLKASESKAVSKIHVFNAIIWPSEP